MKPLVAVFRALLLRCPLCGSGGLRRSATALVERCPRCGFRFGRGETDSFLGAYTINLLGALIVAAAIAALAIVRAIPTAWLIVLAVLAIVAFSVWFYPVGRLVWLALDLVFRPPTERDFEK